jgi:predicted nucleotidyltransferase
MVLYLQRQTEMVNVTDVAETIRTVLRDRQDLAAVYLFGSRAQNQAHALSDVDVAVLFSEELEARVIFERTLEIGVILENALHGPVDVIALNRATPLLRFQVIKHGRLLLEHDRTARCLFVMRALNQYYDAKPYLNYHNALLLSKVSKKGLGRGYDGHRNALEKARQLSARLAANASGFSG